MSVCFLFGLALIVLFSAIQVALHSGRLAVPLGLLYFSLLGVGSGASAFGLVNLALAQSGDDREAQGWFGVFAAVGGLGALAPLVVVAGLTIALRHRLSFPTVFVGTAAVFAAMLGLFGMCSMSESANWW
jgi:hypothetical protein